MRLTPDTCNVDWQDVEDTILEYLQGLPVENAPLPLDTWRVQFAPQVLPRTWRRWLAERCTYAYFGWNTHHDERQRALHFSCKLPDWPNGHTTDLAEQFGCSTATVQAVRRLYCDDE